MILVTAAGGKTGRAVIAALATHGVDVRALRRSGEPVPGAAETVAGDAGDLEPHLDGIDTVYFIWPNFTAGESEGMARAIEAIAGHGLRRIVYHSVLRPGLEAMPHHWDKLRAEERLAESHLDTVTLQPCSYMQNIEPLLDTVRETGLYQPLGGLDAAISFVDLADVGEVAVRACFGDDMLGGTYELAGPQPLTARDVAAELSQALARPVTAREISAADWAAAARSAGLPDGAIRRGRLMTEHLLVHGFSGSPVVLEALLGRPPTQLRQYLESVASATI